MMHRKFMKKAGAALMAAAMALNGAVISSSSVIAAGENVKYEFEDAKFEGEITVESDAAASGGKVLKMTDSGTITLDFDVPENGTYNLIIYAGGIGGSKQQNLSINGISQGVLAIPESDGCEAVKVPSLSLKKGVNTLEISKSWGWSNFDYVTLEEAVLPPIKATQTTPCDFYATAETRSLMNYLSEVYGNGIISGQQEIYQYGPHDYEYEFEYLKDLTGHYPALRGFDYGNRCCPVLGKNNDNSTERVIKWVKENNGIAEATFHLNVPVDFENYTLGTTIPFEQTTYSEKTDFSPSKAATEGTRENEYYLDALDTLAKELKTLEAEGVPIIWRPLHEAEGGGGELASWFWWGREGSEAYKQLWIYTYKVLTEKYDCHNLIWEWNSYNFATSEDWYPGDEYVDIIGYDKYSCTKYLAENNWQPSYEHDDSAIAPTFYGIMEKYDSKKMVAMAENDSFSTLENLTNDKAGWLYFMTWYDGGSDNINFLTNPLFNTKEDTIAMYQSDYCITLDELPKDLYTRNIAPPDPALTTTKVTTLPPTTTTRATTAADPSKNYGKLLYNKADNSYSLTLPKASEEFYLVVEMPKGMKLANGGLGLNVEVDGVTYWVNIKWEANKSGDVKVNVVDDFFNCSIGADVVTDEEIIEKVKSELGKSKTYMVQIWYADGTDDNTTVKIIDGYVSDGSSTTPTTTEKNPDVTDPIVAPTLLGDANDDGAITIADATAVLQSIGNPDKYSLTPQQFANADVCGMGDGLTGLDALTIQLVEIGAIKQSDLPIKEIPKEK